MTTNKHYEFDDQMLLISEYYTAGIYTQLLPDQQGEAKQRRRTRRKNKGEVRIGGVRKRKLSQQQVNLLEQNFGDEHKLESGRKDRLASELGLDPRQVAVWFQNRRARWKSKKVEEEYNKLNTEHENTVVEKCRLEAEVLKLKEQLCKAEKEIQRLAGCCDGVSSNSPNSSFSMEAMNPPFLGESVIQGLMENVFHVPDNSYFNHGLMEWVNLYNYM